MITVHVPAPPRGLWSNLMGLVGLAAVCTAVGLMTDWRWGLLAAGAAFILVAALVQAARPEPVALAEPRPIRAVSVPPKARDADGLLG